MSAAARRAVFLDRDGVLNRTEVRGNLPFAPRRLEHFAILPGVPEAVARLHAAGYLMIVTTNQPDLARGELSPEILGAMHDRLRRAMPLDDILVCPHVDADDCSCRKPKPGMLLEASRKFGIDLAGSHMVGDRWRDVAAGRAAGCRTWLVDYGYADSDRAEPDHRVGSLAEMARTLLKA
ncbi:MAG: HAD family hydrolase [Alphaproteobacteria bacterium]|nr:HAD family hydrolase [Alphaproteobacteria bacterium]